MCVVALLLGMLLFHMLKGVCGCKVVEGQSCEQLTHRCIINCNETEIEQSDLSGCYNECSEFNNRCLGGSGDVTSAAGKRH
jgi:hypothetical protein